MCVEVPHPGTSKPRGTSLSTAFILATTREESPRTCRRSRRRTVNHQQEEEKGEGEGEGEVVVVVIKNTKTMKMMVITEKGGENDDDEGGDEDDEGGDEDEVPWQPAP